MRIRNAGVLALVLALVLGISPVAQAVVFINEVFINPEGTGIDDFYEFIELMGTPGKKLDGYAIAQINGYLSKHYPLNSINNPDPGYQEIDEFFSLDGLSLGANGILVIAIGLDEDFPTLLPDANFRPDWTGSYLGGSGPGPMWNGGLDTPGKLQNDGSNTLILIRNRPGDTQANCPSQNCGNLRWGKDICHDCEIIRPVAANVCIGGFNPGDPCIDNTWCIFGTCGTGFVDQFGDGEIDCGQPNGFGGNTLDLKGASTPMNILDDLEVVDEVSYEHEQGWEYDIDERHVDIGANEPNKFPYRHVHALDDAQGFNPDCLTRVDYRTKGPGWDPAPGATGEYAGGTKNWQDTATEQWIRGESLLTGPRQFHYDNSANSNPDAIQPYRTNVPMWLSDGVAPDYDFTAMNTYPIQPGRVNMLAVPFIPGDSNRDGVCDQEDIDKIAAVFGNDDWIFSNSFASAPEGNGGDPATQTRPWDVDATGDNGIEASDLQWSLNFQGSTNGRIVGVRYDSTTPTPLGSGVVLNPNTGVACTVTLSATVSSGNPLSALVACDTIELIVRAQVTGGANLTVDQENGIMQFVHDVVIGSGGIVRVESVEALGAFATTRSGIQALQGNEGDLGIKSVNGYSTSFTQGLGSTADLYRVTLVAQGIGSTSVSVAPASMAKFAASTPRGLKVGHTASNGNPASASYAAATLNLTVTTELTPDVNNDSVVNMADVTDFVGAVLGTDLTYVARSDFNCDGLVNGLDVQRFISALLP